MMKLEVGKSYLNRKGEVVRIVHDRRNDLINAHLQSMSYPFEDEEKKLYADNGKFELWIECGEEDLMGEYNSYQFLKSDTVKILNNRDASVMNELAKTIFQSNQKQGWWDEGVDKRNKGELLALIHSETSEALEAIRKDLDDEHLPHRKGVEVELADIIIRVLDMSGAFGYDIGGAMAEKFNYNQTRADHQKENREKDGGKKF